MILIKFGSLLGDAPITDRLNPLVTVDEKLVSFYSDALVNEPK
jgi:hypothetical protein